MKFDAEFKEALQMLPSKEKDKLILRLLKKDKKLAEKLYFELVDTDSVEDKREEIEKEIIKLVGWATDRFYSPGYLLMDLRDISSRITAHVSKTKDKEGEISLNCLMIRKTLEQNNDKIQTATYGKAYTLCIYIIARIYKIMALIQKQHEDMHMEFQDDIEAIGKLVGQNHYLMKTAIHNSLDVNWLIQFNIPENIDQIQKELRKNGYLK